jgi:1-pyrroline-5-carboxylate dehydrogenase
VQPQWARTSVEDRVRILDGVADLIADRAGLLAAVASLEVGKTRLEAAGEIDEASELIRYYGRLARGPLDTPLASDSPYDTNVSVLRPFGVFGVIAPFNFPLALVVGPTAAALATGNAVVVKPGPTTSWIALLFARAARDAGLPDGVLSVVTGGDEPGQALVASNIDGLVFTGSNAVGTSILRTFTYATGYARPTIVEMGGKNPAIVTNSADLDAAAAGITQSAYSLSGQKCSACSRVIVDHAVHEDLVDLLRDRASRWHIADPADPSSSTGPVHTADAVDRFARIVAEATARGRIAHGGATLTDDAHADGNFVEPTIVIDLPDADPLTRDEHFVPFLTVERSTDIHDALRRANNHQYGLTAGIFSRDEAEVDAFLDAINAGTVFVNRAAGATSGGWPGHQSYVGWRGSGSTHRGGLGPHYVRQYLKEQGRNIVRSA